MIQTNLSKLAKMFLKSCFCLTSYIYQSTYLIIQTTFIRDCKLLDKACIIVLTIQTKLLILSLCHLKFINYLSLAKTNRNDKRKARPSAWPNLSNQECPENKTLKTLFLLHIKFGVCAKFEVNIPLCTPVHAPFRMQRLRNFSSPGVLNSQ